MKRCVVVAVMQGGKMLIGRRRDSGLWCAPAGHCEEGETFMQAAERELREETGAKGAGRTMTPLGEPVDFGTLMLAPFVTKAHFLDGGPTSTNDPDKEFDVFYWIPVEDVKSGKYDHVWHHPVEGNLIVNLAKAGALDESLAKSVSKKVLMIKVDDDPRWHRVHDVQDSGIRVHTSLGGNYYHSKTLKEPVHQDRVSDADYLDPSEVKHEMAG